MRDERAGISALPSTRAQPGAHPALGHAEAVELSHGHDVSLSGQQLGEPPVLCVVKLETHEHSRCAQLSASDRFVIKGVDGVKLGRQPVDSPIPGSRFCDRERIPSL
jgi:hypothetical protein